MTTTGRTKSFNPAFSNRPRNGKLTLTGREPREPNIQGLNIHTEIGDSIRRAWETNNRQVHGDVFASVDFEEIEKRVLGDMTLFRHHEKVWHQMYGFGPAKFQEYVKGKENDDDNA